MILSRLAISNCHTQSLFAIAVECCHCYKFVDLFQTEKHSDTLAVLMITYPSTNGVFDEDIR